MKTRALLLTTLVALGMMQNGFCAVGTKCSFSVGQNKLAYGTCQKPVAKVLGFSADVWQCCVNSNECQTVASKDCE